MSLFNQELCRQAVNLNHRIMALDALRLARTAREYLDDGCDVMPQSLLDTYEEDMAKRRQRIKIINSRPTSQPNQVLDFFQAL